MSRAGGLRAIALVSFIVPLLASSVTAEAITSRGPVGRAAMAEPINVQVTDGHLGHASAPLVVDPLDPNRLATATAFRLRRPQCMVALTSSDGGTTWSRRACMTWDASYRPERPPTVAFGADGSLYVAAIYWSSLRQRERVEIERSTDGGMTWSHPVPVVTEFGPPPRYLMIGVRLAVDAVPTSPFFGRLYVAAVHDDTDFGDLAITISSSADDGSTWSPARKIVDGGLNDGPNFAFGADGTVFVSYAACYLHSGLSCGHLVYLELQRSTDGGATWSGEHRISIIHTKAGSTTYERVWHNGPSFALSPPIAVDGSSGPFAGRLYAVQVVWTRWHLRLELLRSDDEGSSWSKPVHVAAPRGQLDQFMGSVSVSASGLVGVTWLDRRDDPNNTLYRDYQAFSNDGGRTFSGLAAVATTGSDPALWSYALDEAASAWAGDRLVSAWPDTRTGALQLEVGWIS